MRWIWPRKTFALRCNKEGFVCIVLFVVVLFFIRGMRKLDISAHKSNRIKIIMKKSRYDKNENENANA